MKRLTCIIMAAIMLAAVAGCGMQGSGSNQRPVRGRVPEETPEAQMATATLIIHVKCDGEVIERQMTADGTVGDSFTFSAEDVRAEMLAIDLPEGYTLKKETPYNVTVSYGETKTLYYSAKSASHVALPAPTPTPAPTVYIPDPVVYTGSGDDVIEVTPPEGIWVLRATGNASGRYFAIKGYNSLGEQTELFVNTTEPYSGTTVAPLADVAMLEITAHGDWTIELVSALEMPIVSGGESISGTGDSVFLVHNPGSTATISGNSDSRYFAVISYGTDSIDLMVNTTDEYSGTVMLKGTPVFIAVTAVGDWEIKLN